MFKFNKKKNKLDRVPYAKQDENYWCEATLKITTDRYCEISIDPQYFFDTQEASFKGVQKRISYHIIPGDTIELSGVLMKVLTSLDGKDERRLVDEADHRRY